MQLQWSLSGSVYLLDCFLYEVSASAYEMSEQQFVVMVVVVGGQQIPVGLRDHDWAACVLLFCFFLRRECVCVALL